MPNSSLLTIANPIDNAITRPFLPHIHDLIWGIFLSSEQVRPKNENPVPPSNVHLLYPIGAPVKPGSLEQVNEVGLKGQSPLSLNPLAKLAFLNVASRGV